MWKPLISHPKPKIGKTESTRPGKKGLGIQENTSSFAIGKKGDGQDAKGAEKKIWGGRKVCAGKSTLSFTRAR